MEFTRKRKWLVTGAVALGATVGAAGIAGAASGGSTTAASASASSSASAAPPTPADPATMSHGPNETLLTGTTAEKVAAAAKAAVPGGTIIRVETDSEGSPYEAHVRKADGTYVTVKVDSSFKVTSTENGFGAGPAGTRGRTGSGPGPGVPPGTGSYGSPAA